MSAAHLVLGDMDRANLVVLPQHLLENIKDLLVNVKEVPEELKHELQAAADAFDASAARRNIMQVDSRKATGARKRKEKKSSVKEHDSAHDPEAHDDTRSEVSTPPHEPPPTIAIGHLEALSKWAASPAGEAALQSGGKGEC